MKVLICGDRQWNDEETMKSYIATLPTGTIVIEGECQGADLMARRLAENRGLEVIKCPANWIRFRRAAGPIRNQQMLDEHKPDLVVAFHNHLEDSKGTADMLYRARSQGFKCLLVRSGMRW